MNFDFTKIGEIKPEFHQQKPIIMIHGDEKVGKTSFAASFPKAIVLDLEDGLTGLNVARYPENHTNTVIDLDKIGKFLIAIRDEKHDFETLIIDSFSKAEEHIYNTVMQEENVKSIAGIDYGKGYKKGTEKFIIIMNLLREIRSKRNMTIIIICHSAVTSLPSVDGSDSIEKSPHLYKDSANLVKRYCDLIGYAKIPNISTSETGSFGSKTTRLKGDKSTTTRIIDWGKNPAYVSGARGVSLAETELSYESFITAYNESIKQRQI